MKVDLSIELDCAFEQAVAHVRQPRLLCHVAHPLVSFTPVSGQGFPDVWHEGTHWVKLRLLGLVPLGRQAIVISMPPVAHGFALRDAGYSALVSRWDHLILIEPLAGGGVRYRDQVEVRAGLLTPLVWLFAQCFYRHRQRRWKRLAANDFRYGVAASGL